MSLDAQRPRFMKGDKIKKSQDQVFMIIEKIGVGRCAFVYHARDVRSKQNVALKVYNTGKRYIGALQRELSVFETVQPLENQSLVQYFGHFETLGHHCIVMELLNSSMRHIVYKNNKRGLKLWAVQKFAKDIFRGLALLHLEKLVHADLKPSNIHWSAQHGCFKIIDFGLSFHLSEKNIHQVQSEGYQAPEVQLWNQLKQRLANECCAVDKASSGTSCHNMHHVVNYNAASVLCDCSSRPEDIKSSTLLDEQLVELRCAINNSDKNNWTNNVCNECIQCNRPRKPIDVWSVGCLLIEIATGGKFVKDSSVLCRGKCSRKNCPTRNLIDSRFEDMICHQASDLYTSAGYEVLRDLVYRCCSCDPNTRLTSESALQHPFFQLNLEPSTADLLLFPTPVLLVTNFMDENEIDGQNIPNEIAHKLINKCQHCGPIVSSSVIVRNNTKGSMLVMYEKAQDCQKALQYLSGKVFNNKTIMASYYPTELYASQFPQNDA